MLTGKLLAILCAAAAFGGMLFFAAVLAPLIFARLPAATAGGFIRQVFPVYYLVMAGTTALGALGAARGAPIDGAILAGLAVGFLAARFVLLPNINLLRDAALAGDAPSETRFRLLHRASTVLNTIQLLAVTAVLVRLVT